MILLIKLLKSIADTKMTSIIFQVKKYCKRKRTILADYYYLQHNNKKTTGKEAVLQIEAVRRSGNSTTYIPIERCCWIRTVCCLFLPP